jgi:hypothetical protein
MPIAIRCAMNHAPVQLRLGNGWACQIEVQYKGNGAYDGRAEVLCNGERRCVLVALNVQAEQDALEHLTIRAHAYMAHAACPADDD